MCIILYISFSCNKLSFKIAKLWRSLLVSDTVEAYKVPIALVLATSEESKEWVRWWVMVRWWRKRKMHCSYEWRTNAKVHEIGYWALFGGGYGCSVFDSIFL